MKDTEFVITKEDGTKIIVKVEDDKEVIEIQEKKPVKLRYD